MRQNIGGAGALAAVRGGPRELHATSSGRENLETFLSLLLLHQNERVSEIGMQEQAELVELLTDRNMYFPNFYDYAAENGALRGIWTPGPPKSKESARWGLAMRC